jgi:hypothetical protein
MHPNYGAIFSSKKLCPIGENSPNLFTLIYPIDVMPCRLPDFNMAETKNNYQVKNLWGEIQIIPVLALD